MEIKIKTYNSQSTLLSSILFFILGGVFFTKSNEVVNIISIGLGITLTLFAIIELVIYFYNLQYSINEKRKLLTGIPLLILGIVFIFFSNVVELFIRYIIGGWILLTGISRLTNALSYNIKNHKFISLFITSIILISIGIFTIIKKNFTVSLAGIIMMVYSGIEIIAYIIFNHTNNENESIIIKDNKEEVKVIEEKEKNKKKVKVKKAKQIKEKNKE